MIFGTIYFLRKYNEYQLSFQGLLHPMALKHADDICLSLVGEPEYVKGCDIFEYSTGMPMMQWNSSNCSSDCKAGYYVIVQAFLSDIRY